MKSTLQLTQDVFDTITGDDWKRSIKLARESDNKLAEQIRKIEDELISKLETANFGYFCEEFCVPLADARRAYFQLAIPLAQFAEICKLWPQKTCQWIIDLRNCKKEILKEMLENSRLYRPGNFSSPLSAMSGDPFVKRQNAQLMSHPSIVT